MQNFIQLTYLPETGQSMKIIFLLLAVVILLILAYLKFRKK